MTSDARQKRIFLKLTKLPKKYGIFHTGSRYTMVTDFADAATACMAMSVADLE